MQHMLVSSGKQRNMGVSVMCQKILKPCHHIFMALQLLLVLKLSETYDKVVIYEAVKAMSLDERE
jgi:hypothetical protein